MQKMCRPSVFGVKALRVQNKGVREWGGKLKRVL